MKIKKKQLIMIISTLLMCIPSQIFAWLQYSTYETCNVINLGISWFLKAVAFIIFISLYYRGNSAYKAFGEIYQTKNKKYLNMVNNCNSRSYILFRWSKMGSRNGNGNIFVIWRKISI